MKQFTLPKTNITPSSQKGVPHLNQPQYFRCYCWWFRNPIPNHRLDGAKTLVNNSRQTTNLKLVQDFWLPSTVPHESTWSMGRRVYTTPFKPNKKSTACVRITWSTMLRLPEKNPLSGWSSGTLEGPCLPMPFVVGRLCLADSCRWSLASQPVFENRCCVGCQQKRGGWLPKNGWLIQRLVHQTECFVTCWGKRKSNFFMEGSLWITRVKHVSWKKTWLFFCDRMDADEKRALRQRTRACSWIVIWINIAHLLSWESKGPPPNATNKEEMWPY